MTTNHHPDSILGEFLRNNIEDFHCVLREASEPIAGSIKNNGKSINFALECILITSNIGVSTFPLPNKTKVDSPDTKFSENALYAITNGLTHPDENVRNRALFTTKSLISIHPRIIVDLLTNLRSYIILESSLAGSLMKFFKSYSAKSQSVGHSFFSLLVILVSNKNDRSSKELVSSLISSIIGSEEDLTTVHKNLIDKYHKETGIFVIEWIKIFLPPWASFILDLPILKQLAQALSVPILKFIGPKFIKKQLTSNKLNKRAAQFLIDTYTNKNFPCNALEMNWFLYQKNKISSDTINPKKISDVYRKLIFDDETGKQLKRMAEVNNGLISWYTYTSYPFFFNVSNKHDEIIENLIRTHNHGNTYAKHVAITALWFSRKYMYSELQDSGKLEQIEALLIDYSYKFILDHGGWLDFNHSGLDYLNQQDSVQTVKFVNKQTNHSSFIESQAGGQIVIRYDSSVMSHFFHLLAEIYGEDKGKSIAVKDKIVETIHATVSNTKEIVRDYNFSDQSFIIHAIYILGVFGESHPETALKVLIGFLTNENKEYDEILSRTNKTEVRESVTVAITRIMRIFPVIAKKEIAGVPEREKKNLYELMNKRLDEGLSFSISREGQEVYQHLLLNENIRHLFADAIDKSGQHNSLEDFFLSYINTFFAWIVEKNLPKEGS